MSQRLGNLGKQYNHKPCRVQGIQVSRPGIKTLVSLKDQEVAQVIDRVSQDHPQITF